MAANQQVTEDTFCESLKDAVAILVRLSPHCRTMEELMSVCELALENDGQLRLLLATLSMKK